MVGTPTFAALPTTHYSDIALNQAEASCLEMLKAHLLTHAPLMKIPVTRLESTSLLLCHQQLFHHEVSIFHSFRHAHSGLAHVQCFGCLGEAARFHHSSKCLHCIKTVHCCPGYRSDCLDFTNSDSYGCLFIAQAQVLTVSTSFVPGLRRPIDGGTYDTA